jgi:hypothetical protein
MNKPAAMEELERLTSRVLHDATAPPLGDAQRDELRARVAHHRAQPDEPAVTLDDIRRKLIGR